MTEAEQAKYEAGLTQSVSDAFRRLRWLMLVVSGLVGLGLFHVTMWYGSWDHARVAGRLSVAKWVRDHPGDCPPGVTADGLEAQAVAISSKWSDATWTVPIVGVSLGRNDFSVGLMIVSGAVLVWVMFCVSRVETSLAKLAKAEGWGGVRVVLESQFIILGEHTTKGMRRLAWLLVHGLGLLAIVFLASDWFDVWRMKEDSVASIALGRTEFLQHIVARLALDALFAVGLLWLARLSWGTLVRAETALSNP